MAGSQEVTVNDGQQEGLRREQGASLIFLESTHEFWSCSMHVRGSRLFGSHLAVKEAISKTTPPEVFLQLSGANRHAQTPSKTGTR